MPRAKKSKMVVYWKGKIKRIDYPRKGDLRHDILRYFYRYTPNQIAEKTGSPVLAIYNTIKLMMAQGSLPSLKDFSEKEFSQHKIPSAHLEKTFFGPGKPRNKKSSTNSMPVEQMFKAGYKKAGEIPGALIRYTMLERKAKKTLVRRGEEIPAIIPTGLVYSLNNLDFAHALKIETAILRFRQNAPGKKNEKKLSTKQLEEKARENLKKWGITPNKK